MTSGAPATVRLRLDLAYDGAPFVGFARQPDQVTVQGTLERAAERILGQPIDATCAGRTDRGVHALAQVVHFDLDPEVDRAARALDDLEVFRDRLDRLVGPPITIWAARRVADDFSARFSATWRGYRYRVADTPALAPLARHDCWHVRQRLSLSAMRRASTHLVGEHDFAAFCKKAPGRSSVRRLDTCTIRRDDTGILHLRFVGNAFCHNQVRSLVGSLVEVGAGRREPDWIAQVLASGDRQRAGRVAPPQGLVLERVGYGRRWPGAPPAGVRGGIRTASPAAG
ncbi:tRNA pseudouridine(38-40) synthase TruA [Egicoccus halophilus]|uniref:tRNA pseudouridine synthase A n=1 Tax=Egicoccus halophilus TaxID=1670830 RepID=A0A8J3A9Y9_9ACTN|nr:tRNA pseudouridine(38-40) synthase TruA [Egicoccus halophilus]GGI05880.1 tRNA pseudouridine synthase A [Egicoccus halophilus]